MVDNVEDFRLGPGMDSDSATARTIKCIFARCDEDCLNNNLNNPNAEEFDYLEISGGYIIRNGTINNGQTDGLV